MDEWMDGGFGWMDGWIIEWWMHRWMIGYMVEGWMHRKMDEIMEILGLVDFMMDGWKNGGRI